MKQETEFKFLVLGALNYLMAARINPSVDFAYYDDWLRRFRELEAALTTLANEQDK
jgi:hypothetical protein